MKMFHPNSVATAVVASLILGLSSPLAALAASTPSLGMAASYGVLASTYTNTTATTISGDVGFTTGPAVAPSGTHANYGSGAPYATAGADQGAALTSLSTQGCTFTFGGGAINLSTDITHGTAGIYAPGVYCSSGAMSVAGPLTLSGSGTYIFRSSGALTSAAGAAVSLSSGASACDVFWTPTQAVTLAANTTFAGTVIDDAGITVGANTVWTGRALAFGGTVTTDTHTLTVPSCSAPVVTPVVTPTPVVVVAPVVVAPVVVVTPVSTAPATLHVIKVVVNGNGSSAVPGNFSMFVKNAGANVVGSPTVGTAAPGTAYSLAAGTYVVSENTNIFYTKKFTGDCDANGSVTLAAGSDKTCTLTNTRVPASVVAPVVTVAAPVVFVAPTPTAQIAPTVTAPTPGLPNTGLPPEENNTPWGAMILAGIFTLGLMAYGIRRQQRA